MSKPTLKSTMDNAIALTELLHGARFYGDWFIYHHGNEFVIENECGIGVDEFYTAYIPFRIGFPFDGKMDVFNVKVTGDECTKLEIATVTDYLTELIEYTVIQLALNEFEK